MEAFSGEGVLSVQVVGMHLQVALPPDRLVPGDRVELDGEPVHWEKLNVVRTAEAGEFVYIKYWKKAGVVCTTDRRVPGNIVAEVRYFLQ